MGEEVDPEMREEAEEEASDEPADDLGQAIADANNLFNWRRQFKMGPLLDQQLYIWEPLNIFIVVFSLIRLE